jgi:hypothetical protein
MPTADTDTRTSVPSSNPWPSAKYASYPAAPASGSCSDVASYSSARPLHGGLAPAEVSNRWLHRRNGSEQANVSG